MFGIKRNVAKSVAEVQAMLKAVDVVYYARRVFYAERAEYLKRLSSFGEKDRRTKAAETSMQDALQHVYACDAQAMELLGNLEFHSGFIDRLGSSSDRALVKTLGKKLSDLAADDGNLK